MGRKSLKQKSVEAISRLACWKIKKKPHTFQLKVANSANQNKRQNHW